MAIETKKAAADRLGEIGRKVAHFIESTSEDAAEIKELCLNNGWNDEVAYTLQDALLKLGVVCATLYTWAEDAGLEKHKGE